VNYPAFIIFFSCQQDGLHGCGDDRLLDDSARIQQLINEKMTTKAMGLFDEKLLTAKKSNHETIQFEKG
jgi:hypothetical protein